MADIKLLLQNYGGQDDDQDDEDYSKYYESTMIEPTNPDDLLTPLEKLRKYCTSENIYTRNISVHLNEINRRQIVARSIVETVQSIANEQECLSLLEIITKLSDDIEPSVRCELMEQLPPCCMMIMDMRLVPDAVSGFVLPVMVKYLTDPNNQVRKLSQNALLQLMDQDLIHRDDVESQICPVLIQLTEPESGDDFRTEAVALMTKITPLIGGDVTERLFLKRFGELCSDPLFHVRKVCASNFGDMASVIRRETTESYLLPMFSGLCADGVWGVRKACAETFMSVSGTCSREVRYEKLSPLFVGLLCDKSRWVQMAAYQALGQFIATFADPQRTGFDVNEDGNLVRYQVNVQDKNNTITLLECQSRGETTNQEDSTPASKYLGEKKANQDTATDMYFNSFEFWRTPLPVVDILNNNSNDVRTVNTDTSNNNGITENNDIKIDTHSDSLDNFVNADTSDIPTTVTNTLEQQQPSQIDVSEDNNQENENSSRTKSAVQIHVECLDTTNEDTGNKDNNPEVEEDDDGVDEESIDNTEENLDDRSVSPQSSAIKHAHDSIFEMNPCSDNESDDDNTQHDTSTYSNSVVNQESLQSQQIVPPALLEHYISMTEQSKAQTIDGDLPRHCAFSLPGVVLALGRDNWHLIKETYRVLSTDMQWKVRRTLAFSIHDLANLLGQETCISDLVPIFNEFLKDLDEVRIGVLKHLFDFINILPAELQRNYLNVFSDFLKTDNMRNWRFRQDLAYQLMNLVHLYSVEELACYFCPISLELVCDKVSEVRQYSFHLLCILMQKIYRHNNDALLLKFATNIITLATHHQHWVKRKACAQVYQRFLEGNWYEPERFSKDFLPSLINLCTDVVPNIRLIAAKALLAYIRTEYHRSSSDTDEVRTLVDSTLESLQQDDDRDVRFFSGGKVEERTSTLIFTEEHFADGTVKLVQRGIEGYTIHDDDETELVEEVYIEEEPNGNDENEVVEEYYVADEGENNSDYTHNDGQFYVEEIIEEVVERVGSS